MKWIRLLLAGPRVIKEADDLVPAINNLFGEARVASRPESPLRKAAESAQKEWDEFIESLAKAMGTS
jgi:hypothetical protein